MAHKGTVPGAFSANHSAKVSSARPIVGQTGHKVSSKSREMALILKKSIMVGENNAWHFKKNPFIYMGKLQRQPSCTAT
jgi:hypothetical protein